MFDLYLKSEYRRGPGAVCRARVTLPTVIRMPNEIHAPWSPMPVNEIADLMRGAGFFWCLAGGLAIEHVVGQPYRPHEDSDIVVLRPQLAAVQRHFDGWHLAAADPPGLLRRWDPGERLPWRVHDVWAHRADSPAWELQLMIQEADGESWYYRRDDRVNGQISDLASMVDGVPCLRMDLQLLYKSRGVRLKDDEDFLRLLPVLPLEQRQTLLEWLRLTYPNGHQWVEALESS